MTSRSYSADISIVQESQELEGVTTSPNHCRRFRDDIRCIAVAELSLIPRSIHTAGRRSLTIKLRWQRRVLGYRRCA